VQQKQQHQKQHSITTSTATIESIGTVNITLCKLYFFLVYGRQKNKEREREREREFNNGTTKSRRVVDKY